MMKVSDQVEQPAEIFIGPITNTRLPAGTRMNRRTWLAMTAALLASGCQRQPGQFQGTFLQPWQSYEDLSATEWRRRMQTARALGCSEIVLQWSAHYGGERSWALPQALLALLFDEAAREGMGIRLGLPYDERWWQVLSATEPGVLSEFLARTGKECADVMRTSPWPAHAGFRGWYLPYEIDQYNWATPERRALLVLWLKNTTDASAAQTASPLAVSTFFSSLPTPGTLAGLWAEILDRVMLRPMLQDGVGTAGLGNYAGLEPLRTLLRERRVRFDLIVELFEQLPALPGTNDAFRARSASLERVRAQMQIARSYGAERVLAFAIDPWMLGESKEAQRLRAGWALQP